MTSHLSPDAVRIIQTVSLESGLESFINLHTQLVAEQAFWLKHSNYNHDISVKSHTPVRNEAPSELTKVSLVNESLKKLKYQLASFDKVVKKRITSDAITTDEITKVQTGFNQMEAAVDQCFVDKNSFEIQIKQLRIENDQLLKQIMSQEILHIAVNSVDILNVNKSCVVECNKCLELKTELLKKKDFIEKYVYDKLLKTLKNELRTLKGKFFVDTAVSKPSATIAPGMFKLDLEPISHILKNNRDDHEVYLEKTIENTDTLRGLVECARKQNPSKPLLESACMFTKHVVQIVLWYLDSGCSKHMTGNHSQLINFVSKFLGTVRFGNDHIAKIMGYGYYQMGNVTIFRVYYVEGIGRKLFFVGQFCDSDLEVAFRNHTYFIHVLEGVDLLKGSRGSNIYTLSLENLMLSSPICLLSKASKTKSWLWHRRSSHLNFDYITALAKQGLVRGLPKIKYQKDHLCSAYALGKSKKHSYKPKAEDSIQEKLYLLHMDLCRPMKIQSINRRKYILAIVDDYSLRLNATIRNIMIDNGTKFVNQTLRAYYEEVRISHQTSVARSPQQNSIVKRWYHTLVEVARTMLIFSKALLFLWAEVVATACYTQN
ncbi:retrovirus-related pol polyprotein from transposon TNT 1-94 [Tanacetum coccineum]